MPVDPMDDIELRSVQLQFSNGRGSLSGNCDLRRVITDKGEVLVAVQGDTTKPAILTYHDLGLNCMYINILYEFNILYCQLFKHQMELVSLDFSTILRCEHY